MPKSKNSLFILFAILIVAGIVLYSSGAFQGAAVAFSGDRVVLPIFGSFKCEAGTGNDFIISLPMGSDKSKDYLGLILPYPTWTTSVIKSELGADAIANIVKKCDAYSCEVRNVNDNSFTCPSGYSLIYKFSRGGVVQKEQTATGVGLVFQVSTQIDKLQSSIMTLNESEEYSVQASCISQLDITFAGIGYRRLNARIPQTKITSFVRQKEIYAYYDGSPHKVNNTIGCAFQTLTKGNSTDTGATINVDTITTPKVDFVNSSGDVVSVSENGYPSVLNVGETYTFIYKWQDYPAVFTNIINATDGKKYVLGMANRNLYDVKSVPVGAVTYYVPSTFIKRIPDSGNYCISDEECSIKYSTASLGCNIKDLTFQCSTSKECESDIECQPNSGYLTENAKYYFFTKKCVSYKCATTKTELVCNPAKNYPDNGCTIDKPVCYDGQYCKIKEIPISPCPSECCIAGGTYTQKDCTVNYECKLTGGFVGTCMKKGFCGNDICEPEDGENLLTCPVDCQLIPPTCGNGTCDTGETTTSCPADCKMPPTTCEWYEVNKETQTAEYGALPAFGAMLLNWGFNIKIGVINECVINPLLIIGVFAVIIIAIVAILVMPKKRRRRGK